MIKIPLLSVPNQSVSIVLEGDFYDLVLKAARDVMAMDIVRNSEVLVTGQRLCPDMPLLVYPYLQSGNFYFLTANGEYPYYTEFNTTQSLIYLSAAEVAA